MDVFAHGFNSYTKFVGDLDPRVFWTVVRGAFLVAGAAMLCSLIFKACSARVSSAFLLAAGWTCFLMAVFITLEIPIERLPVGAAGKGILLAYALLISAGTPWTLASYLTRKAGLRKLLAIGFYAILAIAWIVSFL